MAPVEGYTHGHQDSVLRSHRWRTIDNSAAFLKPHLTAETRLLDLGSGAGTITLDFAAICKEVVGVDLSEEVLEQARAAAEAIGRTNLTYQYADGNHLPFADGAFDVCYCHQVLQHVKDPVAVLSEMKRVTKKGGLVAAREADYTSFAFFPEASWYADWLRLMVGATKGNGGNANAGRYLVYWATRAGFDRGALESSVSSWIWQTPEERRHWGLTTADRVLESNVARDGPRFGIVTPADLERISRGWREWVENEDAFGFMPSVQVLMRV